MSIIGFGANAGLVNVRWTLYGVAGDVREALMHIEARRLTTALRMAFIVVQKGQ